MVIHLKFFKWHKSLYYYPVIRPKKQNIFKKMFGGFATGHFGHRYVKIGRYDIILWKVKELNKKKPLAKPIHEQITEMVQTGFIEFKK